MTISAVENDIIYRANTPGKKWTNRRRIPHSRFTVYSPQYRHIQNKARERDRFKPKCSRIITRLPRSRIMDYTNITTSEESPNSHVITRQDSLKSRRHSSPSCKRQKDIFTVQSEMIEEDYYRKRSNSLPSNTNRPSATKDDNYMDNIMTDIRMLAIMTNIGHILIGIAITQLGIVGTWYQHYMNFEKDHLRHVLYVCVIFIILGSYGMFITIKKLGELAAHRTMYIILAILSIIANSFIMGNGIRIVISDSYHNDETVVIIFDGVMLGLSGLEILAVFIGLYVTVSRPTQAIKHNLSTEDLIVQKPSKASPSWGSICSIILNVAHIVLGICITELGMVGMMYRSFMNVDGTGLFAVVFISICFISVGILGLYNHTKGQDGSGCNSSLYTCASLMAVGGAAAILSTVSITMASSTYYAGIEAIVAFDVMILSLSGMEIMVGITATAICLIPMCLSKLNHALHY